MSRSPRYLSIWLGFCYQRLPDLNPGTLHDPHRALAFRYSVVVVVVQSCLPRVCRWRLCPKVLYSFVLVSRASILYFKIWNMMMMMMMCFCLCMYTCNYTSFIFLRISNLIWWFGLVWFCSLTWINNHDWQAFSVLISSWVMGHCKLNFDLAILALWSEQFQTITMLGHAWLSIAGVGSWASTTDDQWSCSPGNPDPEWIGFTEI